MSDANEPVVITAEGEIPEEEAYPSTFYAWYCVIVLMGIYLNSFLDRQILGLLVDPIKKDMSLSDTQLGFLMGPAFAVFYIIAGLPIGWLADRMSRRVLIGIGQFFWSLASVAFGLARGYGQLLAARINVGVGEASLSPSAYSMITDLFPPRRLGLALSVYGMGIYIGAGLANLAGGYVIDFIGTTSTIDVPFFGERRAWQGVFFFIALPTIPLTALLLTMKEPIRKGIGRIKNAEGKMVPVKVPMSKFFLYLRRNWKTMSTHTIGFAWLSFVGYGAAAWAPSLFIRVHGWDQARTGKGIGWVTIIFGPIGMVLAGWLADYWLRKGYRNAKIRVGLLSACCTFPLSIAYPLMPTGELSLTLYAVTVFFAAMPWGVAPAAIQEMMPNRMRGQASAVYLFVVNLLGLALGPQILALFTDYVFKDPNLVHYSLVTANLMAHIFCITLLTLCLRYYLKSLDDLEDWKANPPA